MTSEGDSYIKDPGKPPVQVPAVKLGLYKKGCCGKGNGVAASRNLKESEKTIISVQNGDCCHWK